MIKSLLNKLFPYQMAVRNGMKVGKGVSLASKHSVIFGTEPYLIELGNYVRLSGNICFVTHDGGTWAFRYREEYKNVFKYGRIIVGDHSFIGYGSTILPGVTIGKNCVIGAGSVVTKNVPDGSVVCGVPARLVCTTEAYAKRCVDAMPKVIDLTNYYQNKKEELLKHY